MKMTSLACLSGLVCTSLLLNSPAALAKPLHFHVKGGVGSNVSFTSNAPVEVIEGKTKHIIGDVSFDDSFKFDEAHPFNIFFSVDLASIDTGIELRNEHLRDNFLETGKYPKATYRATSIKMQGKPDLTKPEEVKLVSEGEFTVHGVTERKTIPLTVDYKPGKGGKPATILVKGKFPVKLEEYKIKRPEAIFVKLADTVYVDVDALGMAQK